MADTVSLTTVHARRVLEATARGDYDAVRAIYAELDPAAADAVRAAVLRALEQSDGDAASACNALGLAVLVDGDAAARAALSDPPVTVSSRHPEGAVNAFVRAASTLADLFALVHCFLCRRFVQDDARRGGIVQLIYLPDDAEDWQATIARMFNLELTHAERVRLLDCSVRIDPMTVACVMCGPCLLRTATSVETAHVADVLRRGNRAN